jgi:hypothetical protein
MVALINFVTILAVWIKCGDDWCKQRIYKPNLPISFSGQPYYLQYALCFTSNCGNVSFIINSTVEPNTDFRICPDGQHFCDTRYYNTTKMVESINGANIFNISSDICMRFSDDIGWDSPRSNCLVGHIWTYGAEIKLNEVQGNIELYPVTFGKRPPTPPTDKTWILYIILIFIFFGAASAFSKQPSPDMSWLSYIILIFIFFGVAFGTQPDMSWVLFLPFIFCAATMM